MIMPTESAYVCTGLRFAYALFREPANGPPSVTAGVSALARVGVGSEYTMGLGVLDV
jgi:hypothetical protein